ncbi:ricin-type beta-trefoil lectin domain protein [Streptomyces pseudovenezuelae]|uniref:ricin-type beta-trefoil lectin domain protein n=1 Tax=Streptomyces pseudovenezuelae TaxID=67350 RepID=UPI002E809A4F|nr:ricin-type beta-trefoil lectin domain protein [Streptomyces pseudovenezuelae]WUA90610.1 ricin-type beta-trefoil lectin domain protein [Streptomyces pseudovenezuelae]
MPRYRLFTHARARSGLLTPLLTSAVAVALIGSVAVQPDLISRYAGDDMAAVADASDSGDSYDGFDAKAAEQVRQDQCRLGEVLRMGGPAMFGVAQDGLNQTPDKLHTVANREYWTTTPLSTAFEQDRDAAGKENSALHDHIRDFEISGLPTPVGFKSVADFEWPPGTSGDDGLDFFQQTGISRWIWEQFWKSEDDFYRDPTPKPDEAGVKAVKDLGDPLYGGDPNPNAPDWNQEYEEHRAYDRLLNWSTEPMAADDARLFLSYGGFPRTAPEPGSVEYRIAVEDLKTRFSSCAWRSPADPNKVLGKEVAAASAEWQQEIAAQATPRNQLLTANKTAVKALATGSKALGELLGLSWRADHLVRWQDYWSAGGPGWIGTSPFVVHAHGASDKCLDVAGGKKDNGTPVQIYTCNGSVGQKWQIDGDHLVNPNSGKCLTVKGGASANGTAVQISTCGTGASQKWQYGTHGTSRLYNPGTGNCLDLADYTNSRDGRMWDCTGKAPQQFDVVPSGHQGADDGFDYPTKAQFDKAAKGVTDAQAAAKKQVDLLKAQATTAKTAATTSDTALTTAYGIADKAGAPRGRGLLVGQQKAQVTKASAAALDALAKAGDTAYAATRAAAGDSATVAARALTQAAQSKAAFRTAAANEARAQAKAAADAAALQAQTAKAARDLAKTKLAETQKAEADAKAAAADAHAKRLAAEAEAATAKAEKETAAAKQAEAAQHKQNAQGYAQTAQEAKGRAESAESTARAKRQDAEGARDRAKGKSDDAWDAESKANAARAKADAKDAYADAHDSASDAEESRAAADQADKAADDAESAASSARTEADAATQAAADADAAATRAEAAAKRARSDADAAQAAKLRADAAVSTATSAAADAIKASEASASAARTAVKLADEAEKHAADAMKQADASKAEAAKAVAGAADAAGHAYTTAQAAEDAGNAAQQVAAPANDAIQLGAPYVTTDSAAGLAVLSGQSSKTIAEQQRAVAEAHAANAQKNAAQAASLAAAATGDAKAAYTLAAEAAGFAADARKSAKEALGYAAEAAQYAADAQASLARAKEYDRQATEDAAAADQAADQAETYAVDARSSADQAALDAEAARTAAAEAEQSAKDARAAADRADAEATAAEQAAKDAQKYAESAQEAAESAARKEANKTVQDGAGTGVGGVFYVIEKMTEAAPAKPLNTCDYVPQGCTVTYELHVNVTVSYYFCVNPDVPATEAGCPQEDTVFLKTETLPNQKQEWTHHFSFGDITRIGWQTLFGETVGAVLYEIVLGDAARCYHGDKGACAWFASNFIPGKAFTKVADAVRALDVAMKTGVGVADALKALKALDGVNPATLARIEDSVRLYDDALSVCPVNSFPGSTEVLMADGSRKPIRDVREGELVLAGDPVTGRLRAVPVTDTYRHDTSRMTDIAVSGGLLTSTRGHRFYVEGRGWITVASLAVGDRLRTPDGTTSAVTALADRSGRAEVFDLTVDDLHTFFVRTQGQAPQDVLVHNCLKIINDEGISGAHTLKDHVRPPDSEMAAKALDPRNISGVATRWTSKEIAEQSVNEAFQQWIARNPRGLDSWMSRMRNKFGRNGDRGYFDPQTDLKSITWTLKDAKDLGLKWVRNGAQKVDAGNKVIIQLKYVGRGHPSGYVVYTAYLAG